MSTRATSAVFAVVLTTFPLTFGWTAKAGDLDLQPYGPNPYAAPIERGGLCRFLLERRIDGYGREVVHRIRICDEGPVYSTPGWSAPPQQYGYGPPRYYERSRSYYDDYLRPPAPVGPAYYN